MYCQDNVVVIGHLIFCFPLFSLWIKYYIHPLWRDMFGYFLLRSIIHLYYLITKLKNEMMSFDNSKYKKFLSFSYDFVDKPKHLPCFTPCISANIIWAHSCHKSLCMAGQTMLYAEIPLVNFLDRSSTPTFALIIFAFLSFKKTNEISKLWVLFIIPKSCKDLF